MIVDEGFYLSSASYSVKVWTSVKYKMCLVMGKLAVFTLGDISRNTIPKYFSLPGYNRHKPSYTSGYKILSYAIKALLPVVGYVPCISSKHSNLLTFI